MPDQQIPLGLAFKCVEPCAPGAPHLHPIMQPHRETRAKGREPPVVAGQHILGSHNGGARPRQGRVCGKADPEPDRELPDLSALPDTLDELVPA